MELTYENYKELLENDKELAQELLEQKGSGEWQGEEIYYYDDKESFAEHELYEGWYADLRLGDVDWKGAPNPVDFINLEELGSALIRRWDESCNFESEGGEILTTSCGW